MNNTRYKSVHEYMDTLFRGKTPTKKEIQEAKLGYRKLYQKHYREIYNKNHVQITFRVSKKEFKKLERFAKQKEIKVTKLAKNRALKTSENHNLEVKIQLSELIDSIEEAIYQKRVIDPISILKQLEIVEQKL